MIGFNYKMTEHKTKWAEAVMAYNRTCKEAFRHRFVEIPQKEGRQTADGNETAKTGEELYGVYKTTDIFQEKVDQYYREFKERNYHCTVDSIPFQDKKELIQYMMKTAFENPEFDKAKNSAFKDALIKGVGFLRPRIYDFETEVKMKSIPGLRSQKSNKTKTKVTRKKGLTVEYVDVENVYMDHETKNPFELFISTPVTPLELVKMFPMIKDKIDLSFYEFEETKKIPTLKNDFILQEYMPNYRVGEFFTKMYFRPEQSSLASLGVNDADEFGKFLESNDYDYRKGSSLAQDEISSVFQSKYDDQKGYSDFYSNWGDYWFGDGLNGVGHYLNDRYRINEYYNWQRDEYILFVGDYILYRGPMLEPYCDMPLQPIYFDHTDDMESVYGESLYQKIKEDFKDLNESENDIEESKAIAGTNIIMVNQEALENPNEPIQASKFTAVRYKAGADQLGNVNSAPPLQQMPLKDQALEIKIGDRNERLARVESKYPKTSQLSAQLNKDNRQETIFSPDLVVSSFLKEASIQLSRLARKVFAAKLFELDFFGPENSKISMPFSQNVALFIRSTEEDIARVKKKVLEELESQYKAEIDEAKRQIVQGEDFKQMEGKVKQEMMANLTNAIKQGQMSESEANDMIKSEASRTGEALGQMAEQQAAQLVPQPQDNNLYLSLASMSSFLGVDANFKFSFDKSRREREADLMAIQQLTQNMPMAGFMYDYSTLAKEVVLAYDLNPDIIAREIPPANKIDMQQRGQFQYYVDMQKNMTVASNIMKQVYGEDILQQSENNPIINDLQTAANIEAEKEIKIQTARIAESSKGGLAKEAFKKQSEIALKGMEGGGMPPAEQDPTSANEESI